MVSQDIFAGNLEGFNMGNQAMLEDLSKSLQAGAGTDASQFTGGRALIPESLDRTLVNVLWSQDDARLFKILKKTPVASTVHEYTRRTGVGDSDGAWVSEGGTSFEKNQTLARITLQMKFLQTYRAVTLQMASANAIEDAKALEAEAGMLWCIQQVEKTMFTGNSNVVAEQFDGLRKIVLAAGNSYDMRGKPASDESFEDAMGTASTVIRQKYGKADLILAPPPVIQGMQALLRSRLLVPPAPRAEGNAAGYVPDFYPTPFGNLKIQDDIFIARTLTPTASVITASAPGAPTFTVANAANASSQFVASDAGTYYYVLVGVNKYGESVASAAVQATVNAGDAVTLTITVASTNATGYRVYRGSKNAATAADVKFMVEVEGIVGGVTTLPTTIVDLNADIPGTYDAYVLTSDPMYNAIEWAQFLPAMLFNLYPTNAATYPFLVLLFGALAVKKQEQMYVIKNIASI